VLARIAELHMKYPDLEVSIDGSVNETTLPRLREAGARRFVAGSSILGADDPEAAFRSLERLAMQ
jgi:ribulose-phosphate 3-epimerase